MQQHPESVGALPWLQTGSIPWFCLKFANIRNKNPGLKFLEGPSHEGYTIQL